MWKSATFSGTKGGFHTDSDVRITYEDQQKINKFILHNAKSDGLKEELKLKQNELRNMEDACDELLLVDGDENIPFLWARCLYTMAWNKHKNAR